MPMKIVSNRRADIGRLSARERDTGAILYRGRGPRRVPRTRPRRGHHRRREPHRGEGDDAQGLRGTAQYGEGARSGGHSKRTQPTRPGRSRSGQKVNVKAALNRRILEQAWGPILRQTGLQGRRGRQADWYG